MEIRMRKGKPAEFVQYPNGKPIVGVANYDLLVIFSAM